MPQYILVYLGGEFPTDPEEGQKHFQRYQQWLNSLGDKVVSPAIPFKDTHTVQADGTTSPGSTTAMSGLSIIRSASMDEALAAAKSCPFLEINGVPEISEMVEMTGTAGDPLSFIQHKGSNLTLTMAWFHKTLAVPSTPSANLRPKFSRGGHSPWIL